MEQQRKIILLICVGILLMLTFYEFNGLRFFHRFGNCIDKLFNNTHQKESFLSETPEIETVENNIDELKPQAIDMCYKDTDATFGKKKADLNKYCDNNAITKFKKQNYNYLLKGSHVINRPKYKEYMTTDIGISKIFTGEFNPIIGKQPSTNDNVNLRMLKVMKEEALAIARKDLLCESVTVGNTPTESNFGKAFFWEKCAELKNATGVTTYIKKYNYAYTIMFFIKLDSTNTLLNNFFHHGNETNEYYPSLNIEPNSNTLSINISILNINTGKPSVQYIILEDIEIRQWTHIAIILNSNVLTLFTNGNERLKQELDGDMIWPCQDNEHPIYFSYPKNNAVDNVNIYDFIWIPHVISQSLIHDHYLTSLSSGLIDSSSLYLNYTKEITTTLESRRNGKYCADDDGQVTCNRDKVGPWEKFNLVPQQDGVSCF